MKMKRILAMAVSLALIFSFSAYGSVIDDADYTDYEIQFMSDGATYATKFGECNTQSDKPLVTVGSLPKPEKEGYCFDGWYTDAGVKVTEDYVMTEKLLYLYARWNVVYKCGEDVYAIFNPETSQLVIRGNGPMYSLKNAKSYPWHHLKSSITCLVVEEGVTELGAHAFEGYTNIKNASIPDGVVVGKNALKKVTLN